MVKTSRETLFVHPVPSHLAKHVTSNDDATPHIVYRGSYTEDDSLRNDPINPPIEGKRLFKKN